MKAIIKKIFPIKDRTDFYKYMIVKPNGKLATDWKGKAMFFDSFALDKCVSTLEAINRVSEADTSFPEIGSGVMSETAFYKWLKDQPYELPKFIEAIKLYTGMLVPFKGREDGTNHRYVFDYFWHQKLRS